ATRRRCVAVGVVCTNPTPLRRQRAKRGAATPSPRPGAPSSSRPPGAAPPGALVLPPVPPLSPRPGGPPPVGAPTGTTVPGSAAVNAAPQPYHEGSRQRFCVHANTQGIARSDPT